MLYGKKDRREASYLEPIFGSVNEDELLPSYQLGEKSIEPRIAYQMIKDDLLDEGNSRLNLATFCQTFMEPEAVKLMSETLDKNMIDKSEYPRTAEMENRCVNIIADLWHARGPEKYIGTSTIGSSEACMLGGMAMKFAWRQRTYDDIKKLDQLVEEYNQQTQHKVYIHVDAASGGLYAPFVEPELEWDFQLKNVISINTSGHKYGLVYPGVGWIVWRDEKYLPEELVFKVSYLGGEMPTMAINFSHSAAQMIGQYYNFVRFGFDGYQSIHQRTHDVAVYLAKEIERSRHFEIINDGSQLPLVCYKLAKDEARRWTLYDLSDRLLMKGWQVPSYPLPKNLEYQVIQRIVVRSDFGMNMAYDFIEDLKEAIKELENSHLVFHEETEIKNYGFTH